MKKLYRSETNKMVAGIIGGIAEYFETDATLLRLVWVLVVVFTGFVPGIIAYLLAMIVVPPAPHATHNEHVHVAHEHSEKKEGQHHPHE